MTDTLQDEHGELFADEAGTAYATRHANQAQTGLRPMAREVKVVVLVLQDRRGRKTYQRLLDQGWTMDSTTPRTLSRAVTVTFSRPKMTRRERKLVAKMNRRHA